jgi:16S rRNA (cytidine1402-2'-O)-methyltransferase
MPELGRLYIVATPIGNPQDITLRALDVLRSVDAIICEELREGSTLVKKLGLPTKELVTLNEHNEQDQIMSILTRMAQGQSLALISDCGTPVFADPGAFLIDQVDAAGFEVIPIPGPSSLMAALSVLNFKLDRFIFGGFLPRIPEQRRDELQKLRSYNLPLVLMDTPYRLNTLLDEVDKCFGSGQAVTLACDISLPKEKIYRGSVKSIRSKVAGQKCEFILIVHPPVRQRH